MPILQNLQKNWKHCHQYKMQYLIQNIDKIHTTQNGVGRIVKNTGFFEHFYQKDREIAYNKIIDFCRQIIKNPNAKISICGKNYYVESDSVIWTINRHSFTIITAHKKK